MAAYLDACMEEAGDDAACIAAALGDIARARGMAQLAKDTGISREGLYKALSSDGNPSLATVLKVVRALGLKQTAQVCLTHSAHNLSIWRGRLREPVVAVLALVRVQRRAVWSPQ